MTRHEAALAVTGLGVLVTLLACLGAAIAADALPRLHFATVVTSLGGPVVGAGLCLELGWSLSSASVALTVVLLALAGPALSGAVGRVVAQREGLLPPEEPE